MTVIWLPSIVFAGMPSPELVVTELGKRRLEEISFFVVCFFLGAAVFRLLWNLVQKDIPWWPRLSYRGTLGLLCVWGCLLTVVLSLISGARELMTPAAWRPKGITYQVSPGGESEIADLNLRGERFRRLENLRAMLWKYAAEHRGEFPIKDAELKAIPDSFWIAVPGTHLKYVYTPAATELGELSPLVMEPEFFDDGQLVLKRNGEV
ncbi:MAG: hypothetical protein JWN70_1996, partial [Planctomycetaceae bacterium]|nr:hypothetical protein [Planctomycetaceae bacterium]